MTRKCFFVGKIIPDADHVVLSEGTAHHVESVLRSKVGDAIEVRDGCGNGWRGVISGIKGGSIRVQLTERQELKMESPLRLTLALAFSRSDRMELVLRQATELGIHRFVAFRAQRSQYGLSQAQLIKKKERWTKITREALCQCGRTQLPEIHILSGVQELVESVSSWEGGNPGLRLLALEAESQKDLLSLWRDCPRCQDILAAVGPEGGWTESEVQQFKEAGFFPVNLGPRILRLETAATAFLASAQLLWGDFTVERSEGTGS